LAQAVQSKPGIVAVGRQRASLRDGHDQDRRIPGIDTGRRTERSAGVHRRQAAHFRGERTRGVDGSDAGEIRLDGTGPEALDARLARHAGVEIADLPFGGPPAVQPLDDGSHVDDRLFGQFAEGVDRDAIGRDRRRLEPPAVDEAVEVVLWAHAAVERRGVEPRLQRRFVNREQEGGDRDGSDATDEVTSRISSAIP